MSKSFIPDNVGGLVIQLDVVIPLLASLLELLSAVTPLQEEVLSLLHLQENVNVEAKARAETWAEAAAKAKRKERDDFNKEEQQIKANEDTYSGEGPGKATSIILRGAAVCVRIHHTLQLGPVGVEKEEHGAGERKMELRAASPRATATESMTSSPTGSTRFLL